MNEIESQTDPASPAQATEERSGSSIDLASRPETTWLDEVQTELDDTDLVLKCLARDSAKMCETCDGAQASGELAQRAMLARCAQTKQPR